MSTNTNLTNNTSELQEVLEILQNKAAGPVLQDKTATPAAITQIIEPDSGYDGLNSVTVVGDANLLPENIMSGVSIFGVEGNAEGGGTNMIKITIQENIGETINYYNQDAVLQTCPTYTTTQIEALNGIITFTIPGLHCSISGNYVNLYSYGGTYVYMFLDNDGILTTNSTPGGGGN